MGIFPDSEEPNTAATYHGPVTEQITLSVTIHLKRHPHELTMHHRDDHVHIRRPRLLAFRHSIYPDKITKIVAAFPNLTLIHGKPEWRSVLFQGTTDQINSSFNIQLGKFKDGYGRDFISHNGPYSVPDSVEDLIGAVLGLNTRPIHRPKG